MSAISITRIGEALGAEVSGIDVSKPIAADTFAAIRKAWLDNLVIRFRGQKLSDPANAAVQRALRRARSARAESLRQALPAATPRDERDLERRRSRHPARRAR